MTASFGMDDVRLAHLHLRVGMLPLALAELEDLERRGQLSGTDRSMLAEARWRSGDADGAASAARAHLEGGGTEPVALCIAAEAAAAEGRPGEARSFMDRLGLPDATTLDALFAGMPRRAFWPSAPPEPGQAGTLFSELDHAPDFGPPAARETDRSARGHAAPTVADRAPDARRESAVPGPQQVLEATAQDLWPAGGRGDSEAAATASTPPDTEALSDRRDAAAPAIDRDPVAELTRARSELVAEPDRALLRLALALRLDPTLAPAVLDLLAGRSEPAAMLLRGDAQRLLGRHLEAEAAFAGAAARLAGHGRHTRS